MRRIVEEMNEVESAVGSLLEEGSRKERGSDSSRRSYRLVLFSKAPDEMKFIRFPERAKSIGA